MRAYIFFAPESMRAGGFWQQQLADEIAQSTAFVLLVGENGVGLSVGERQRLQIARILAAADGDLPRAAQGLIDAANARGGEDNITVILLGFQA